MEAIIFDYGGVICSHPSQENVNALAALCGLTPERFLEIYWSERVPYDRAEFTPGQYWGRFAAQAGRTYTPEQVAEFRKRDIGFWLDMDPVMLRWIREIRSAGIKVGLISNLPVDLGEYLRTSTPLFTLFDHVTLSYEQQCVKPDAPIYMECCHGLGLEPGECLFLDDREHNVKGAEAVGMKALLFESPKQMAALLGGEAHGLLPYGTPPMAV